MVDKRFKKFVIDYHGNLPKILKDMDIRPQQGGLMFCPMHDNYNTPAAKLFKDKTGWHFYCFSENRQFGTYDVYKDCFSLNMDKVFDSLWSQLSESDKNQMYDIFGEFDDESPVENLDVYQAFRQKRINYSQLKLVISSRISNEK